MDQHKSHKRMGGDNDWCDDDRAPCKVMKDESSAGGVVLSLTDVAKTIARDAIEAVTSRPAGWPPEVFRDHEFEPRASELNAKPTKSFFPSNS